MCLIYKERYGIDLDFHGDQAVAMKTNQGARAEPYMSGFSKIDLSEAKEGDLLHLWTFYNGHKLPLHVGLVVGPRKVIHTDRGAASVIEDYWKPTFSWRLIGAYRYAQ